MIVEKLENNGLERKRLRSFPKLSIIAEHSGCNENDDKSEIELNVDSLLEKLKREEPTSDNQFFRLSILSYELGDLSKSVVYAERFKNDCKGRIIHLANGKLAMADLLTQLYLLCISMGWDFQELRKLGAQHLKERHEDFKENGWSEI